LATSPHLYRIEVYDLRLKIRDAGGAWLKKREGSSFSACLPLNNFDRGLGYA